MSLLGWMPLSARVNVVSGLVPWTNNNDICMFSGYMGFLSFTLETERVQFPEGKKKKKKSDIL